MYPLVVGLDDGLMLAAPLGIGGGALGFSKLDSWFCRYRGLAGGEINEDAANGPEPSTGLLIPRPPGVIAA